MGRNYQIWRYFYSEAWEFLNTTDYFLYGSEQQPKEEVEQTPTPLGEVLSELPNILPDDWPIPGLNNNGIAKFKESPQ